MRIAVPALGPDTRSAVAPTFGRCLYFVVVDTGSHETTVIENTVTARDSGVGTGAVQLLADAGVRTVLARRCGPQAARGLTAARIDVRLGHAGTVGEAVEMFTAGLPR